jgi:hypothetical protein
MTRQRRHGTFRPNLLALVQSNSEADIEKQTKAAFKALSQSNVTPPMCLDHLTKLRGVGPATASLVLSAYGWKHAPFFGDEVFRWVCWDEPPTKGTRGWDRKIAYSKKEYVLFYERVAEMVKRLDISALDVEMIGYVLGKTRVDIDKGSAKDVIKANKGDSLEGGTLEVSSLSSTGRLGEETSEKERLEREHLGGKSPKGENPEGVAPESKPQKREPKASNTHNKEAGRSRLKTSMADAKLESHDETSNTEMDLKTKSSSKRKASNEPGARRSKRNIAYK